MKHNKQNISELFRQKFRETYDHEIQKGPLKYTIKNGYAVR